MGEALSKSNPRAMVLHGDSAVCRDDVDRVLPLQLLRLLHGLFDGADVHEGLFGQGVVLAVANLLEAADAVVELRVVAGEARERLGDVERLA